MRHCCHNFEIFIIFLRLLLLFYSYFCAVKEIEHEIDSRQWKHEDRLAFGRRQRHFRLEDAGHQPLSPATGNDTAYPSNRVVAFFEG